MYIQKKSFLENCKTIIVIGGGASGFFAAINSAINFPNAKIIILEKTNHFLSKVKISGGGRCNVTNETLDKNKLCENFPRGKKELKQVFFQFNTKDTIEWFAKRNVKLITEKDFRMFPESNTSSEIINCFLNEANKYNVEIKFNKEVLSIQKLEPNFLIKTNDSDFFGDAIICCVGGFNNLGKYEFIKNLGHTIISPIPSLFTFNVPNSDITKLMGISKDVTVKLLQTKYEETGSILITHWGFSGPVILKLSSFAAIDLFNLNYSTSISINWINEKNESRILEQLNDFKNKKIKIGNLSPFQIPKRLWEYLVTKSEIDLMKNWNELNKKEIHKIIKILSNDIYVMNGKTTFKEEFVTAGGIDLKEINFKTMESKIVSNLFFCGEVLNIDGITGGFNFQNAWSTSFIAAKNVLFK